MDMVRERELNVPIFQKQNLTIEEAAVYSNIGQHKLRELTADERCPFVLWVGNKTNGQRSFCGWGTKGLSSAGSLMSICRELILSELREM